MELPWNRNREVSYVSLNLQIKAVLTRSQLRPAPEMRPGIIDPNSATGGGTDRSEVILAKQCNGAWQDRARVSRRVYQVREPGTRF
jgi:hypothetical protein